MRTAMRALALLLVLSGITSGIAACDHIIRGTGEDIRDTSDDVTPAGPRHSDQYR